MREKHPIDERFKGLYEAEVTPPSEVRDALAGRLGWDLAGRTTGTWSRWVLMAAGAALLISGGIYFSGRRPMDPTPSRQADQEKTVRSDDVGRATSGEPGSLRTNGDPPTERAMTDNAAGAGTSNSLTADPRGSGQKNIPSMGAATLTSTARTAEVELRRRTSSAGNDQANEGSSAHRAGHSPLDRSDDIPALSSAASELAGSASATSSGAAAESRLGRLVFDSAVDGMERPAAPGSIISGVREAHAGHMDARPITMHIRPEAAIRPGPTTTSYVVPSGDWFIGLTIGTGRMTGTWRAQDEDGLTNAERWRGSTLWGLDMGREWRSGWSVRSGLGLALDRSTFAWDVNEVERFTDLDTSWTETLYNNTQDVVYTWNIDTVQVERPGATSTVRASNQYGAIRVPLTVAWYSDVRRWRFGAFSGVTAFLTTQRQGSTLVRTADDAGSEIVDLDDERVDRRFGPRMNAHAGLSLGFHVTEHMTVLAEPMLSVPISDLGHAGAPWMRGHLFQFRLQHVLGASTH